MTKTFVFRRTPIYNAASIKTPVYESLSYDMVSMVEKFPSVNMLGIPSITYTTCVYYAWMIRIVRNIIPALIIDGILKITAGKTKLMKIQRIVYNTEESLKYFKNNSFKFDNFNFVDLQKSIPEHEKDEFFISERIFNITVMADEAFKIGRKVLLHETDESDVIARKRLPYIFGFAHFIHVLFIYGTLKLLYNIANRFI